jgi:hypothetical protein
VGVDCEFTEVACSFTPSNTYTVYVPESGSVTVCVTVQNDAGCTASTCTTITATPAPAPTIALNTAATTTNQTVVYGTAIAQVRYTITNATGTTVSGLPAGVNYTWNNSTVTISGTPTAAGTHVYTVTPIDGCGVAGTATAQGTITVTAQTFSMTPSQTNVYFAATSTGMLHIDWGDGTSNTYTGNGSRTHTYSPAGTYTIVGTVGRVTMLDCYNQSLTALDVSGCTALTTLNCYSNSLTALIVSTNTALTSLACTNNQLTALDVSMNTALTTLSCYSNQLTALNVSANTALTFLWCSSNQLTALNVSANTALATLQCNINQLTALDVTTNTALTDLRVQSNLFTAVGLNTLFGMLPSGAGSKTVYIYSNPGTASCTQSIATGNGWSVNTTTEW